MFGYTVKLVIQHETIHLRLSFQARKVTFITFKLLKRDFEGVRQGVFETARLRNERLFKNYFNFL